MASGCRYPAPVLGGAVQQKVDRGTKRFYSRVQASIFGSNRLYTCHSRHDECHNGTKSRRITVDECGIFPKL